MIYGKCVWCGRHACILTEGPWEGCPAASPGTSSTSKLTPSGCGPTSA